MIRKKYCILIMFLLLSLASCARQEDKGESKLSITASDIFTKQTGSIQYENEEKTEIENYEEKLAGDDGTLGVASSSETIYAAVIQEYVDMVKNNFYEELLTDPDYSKYENSFGKYIGLEIRAYKQAIFYSFYDVDGNGIDEMIIAGGEEGIGVGNANFAPWNYDIYTFDGKQVVHLFSEMEFGYRTNFALYQGGIIAVSFSGSAAESGITFYKIGSDGVTPESVKEFSMVGSTDGDDIKMIYYQNSIIISEEEYHTKIREYGDILREFDWIEVP